VPAANFSWRTALFYVTSGWDSSICPLENLMEEIMAWTAPVAVEVCVGMEVTSYASAEI
jgi:coenzyme PQQ precursor peptide PqqA